MLQRLKDNILSVLLFPVLILSAVVYALTQKNKELQAALKIRELEGKTKETDVAAQEAAKDAQEAESNYRALADQYERESHGAGGDGQL